MCALQQDFNVQCDSHFSTFSIASVVLLLVVVVLPPMGLAWFISLKAKQGLLEQPQLRSRLGFL